MSFRFLLGLALVVVNVSLAAVVATLAYRAAHDAVVEQAFRSVSLVADSRNRALTDFLTRRQRRLDGFLGNLISLCGERYAGRLAFEDQCLRTAIRGLHSSELASSTEVRYRERRLARVGEKTTAAPPVPGQLARLEASEGAGVYAMRATREDLSVDAVFDLDEVNAIFADRAGLENNGESFMTDGLGYRLTKAVVAAPAGYPVQMPQVGSCVRGFGQVALTPDYHGVDVISAAQPTRGLGGGCIVANVTYDEAVIPVERLASVLAWAAALLGLLGGVVSMIVAGVVTRPIQRLATAARSLADGNLDTVVPISGPSEVRQLGTTFSRMASSIRDLVRSERTARFNAEAASRTKDEFLATLSHELRTPLNAILGWASILTHTNYDRTRVVQAVRVIERNARLQAQMIEELLDVSRIAAGRVKLNLTDVVVSSAMDAALDSARPAAEAKGVQLQKHVEAQTATVKADPRRLQQIIWNLLSNAVRFTPGGGRVSVAIRRVAGSVEIVVQDTGCGISRDFLPIVFERFRQADSSTTRAHGGLGLGLAIVRDLVELHGGTVTAESEGENRGTTITVRLPEAADRHHTDSVLVHPSHAMQLAGARVLVVDDDPDARDVLKTILEDAGARVMTTATANETRALLNEMHPDLLIADIGMPGEDGYSLIRSIRRLETRDAQIPAIALTAHSRPEDVRHALASGFQLHVAKPIDSGRLVTSIASLFDTVN